MFSNMMIAICSKFGTSGLGVVVSEGGGTGVCVGNEVEVGKSVTVGLGAAAGALAQAVRISRTSRVRKSFVFMVVSGRLYSQVLATFYQRIRRTYFQKSRIIPCSDMMIPIHEHSPGDLHATIR